jgi:cell division protein FtsB
MAQTRTAFQLIRSAAGPAAALMIMAFFGGYALFGSNGVLALGDYRHNLAEKQVELDRLEAQKKIIANRVALLDPKKANPDMVDELIRKELGLAHPDEIIIPLDDVEPAAK